MLSKYFSEIYEIDFLSLAASSDIPSLTELAEIKPLHVDILYHYGAACRDEKNYYCKSSHIQPTISEGKEKQVVCIC